MYDVIYNVLIGGNSIGMTWNKEKAEGWMNRSMYQGEKKIVAVPYSPPTNGERPKYD